MSYAAAERCVRVCCESQEIQRDLILRLIHLCVHVICWYSCVFLRVLHFIFLTSPAVREITDKIKLFVPHSHTCTARDWCPCRQHFGEFYL